MPLGLYQTRIDRFAPRHTLKNREVPVSGNSSFTGDTDEGARRSCREG